MLAHDVCRWSFPVEVIPPSCLAEKWITGPSNLEIIVYSNAPGHSTRKVNELTSFASHSMWMMAPNAMRPFVALTNQYVCASCRRTGNAVIRQPNLRPLHASPIFQRPRRRDFFSSNTSLSQPKPSEIGEIPGGPSGVQEAAATQKRRTARSPAVKTSLRRVAVEAQRSRDGNLSRSRRVPEDASTPKLLTAYGGGGRIQSSKSGRNSSKQRL